MIDKQESLRNLSTGAMVATRLMRADSWFHRLRGLIGYAELAPGEALWIEPCSQVHTHFMGYGIHVAFLDRTFEVVLIIRDLGPWRMSPWERRARVVVELSARADLPVRTGDRLSIVTEPGAQDLRSLSCETSTEGRRPRDRLRK